MKHEWIKVKDGFWVLEGSGLFLEQGDDGIWYVYDYIVKKLTGSSSLETAKKYANKITGIN